MGIVVGVVIEVSVAAAIAAEEASAAAVALAIAAGETTAVAIDLAADAAAETAAEADAEGAATAAENSAAESEAAGVGETLSIANKVAQGIKKFIKFTNLYFAIDAIFRTAVDIMVESEGHSSAVRRLLIYSRVLDEMSKKMSAICLWLQNHQETIVTLKGINVPLDSGILARFMTPLSAGAGNLQTLAKEVERCNKKTESMTFSQLEWMKYCLMKANRTFENMTTFMNEKKASIQILSTFPINRYEVEIWKGMLGHDDKSTE